METAASNQNEPATVSGSVDANLLPSPPNARLEDVSKQSPPDMTFSSSPVLYPASSSPVPVPTKKRKLFQTLRSEPASKKTKVVGGFLEDIDEDAQNDDHYLEKTPTELGETLHPEQPPHKQVQPILNSTRPISLPRDGASNPTLPLVPRLLLRKLPAKSLDIQTSTGQSLKVPIRPKAQAESYEQIIANRSNVAPGRAKKAYYGIEIHKLVDDARIQGRLDDAQRESEKQQGPVESIERPVSRGSESGRKASHQLWTEKYRAKKFTELVGDERTHRLVLRWLKAWDEIVFPGNKRSRPKRAFGDTSTDQERQHRKILLLTGPPGLGKTTLAHVCAKQAGYGALEINASDDRSRDVVKGRIKDALGTETVRGVKEDGKDRRAGRPACIIVDEVDGVVTGAGGSGEGGFIKALIDLVHLDQRNSNDLGKTRSESGKQRKGDKFRMLRPLILICNDVYAPSLRPLRTSALAEIVHVRKPAVDKLISRLKTVFDEEKLPCDNDAVRRICEASWGMGSRRQNSLGGRGAGEGDIRGILVQAEWIAHKFRSGEDFKSNSRLSRKWVESHLADSQSASGQKGLGRGGVREVVDRVFVEGAGIPILPTTLSADDARLVADAKTTSIGVADLRKRAAITSLREMIDTCGDHDRIMTECFATYPTQMFQDDVQLSKPNEGYDWLHFHDCLSSRIYGHQEWELNPYLSTSACGFHSLFASPSTRVIGTGTMRRRTKRTPMLHPFSGIRADFTLPIEAEKQNRTLLTELQSSFAAPLQRLFSSVDAMATELMPNVSQDACARCETGCHVGGSGGSAYRCKCSKRKREDMHSECCTGDECTRRASFDKVKIETDRCTRQGGDLSIEWNRKPAL